MNIREPAVTGMFYPAGAGQLRHELGTLLDNAHPPPSPAPKAMIVPHAGYVYSGPVAATAYRSLIPVCHDITRVVLFGPAHRVYLEGIAVSSAEGFETPLGIVPIDRPITDSISKLPGVCTSDAAHKDEHSLEVQLPFLQTVLETFTLVPILVGRCQPDQLARVIDAVWGGPETLIIVSSDLSHYRSYEEAQQIDSTTRERILQKTTTLTGEEACGAHAINGLMASEHGKNLCVNTVDIRNSGDTGGDKSRVVGYGAFLLH